MQSLGRTRRVPLPLRERRCETWPWHVSVHCHGIARASDYSRLRYAVATLVLLSVAFFTHARSIEPVHSSSATALIGAHQPVISEDLGLQVGSPHGPIPEDVGPLPDDPTNLSMGILVALRPHVLRYSLYSSIVVYHRCQVLPPGSLNVPLSVSPDRQTLLPGMETFYPRT